MPWWIILIGIAAFVAANLYGLLAFNNLSQHGLQNMVRTFFWWPKIYAGREHFTDKGWKYRNTAITLQLIVLFVFIIFVARTCGRTQP